MIKQFAVVSFCFILLMVPHLAQANVMVSPIYVIFDNRMRSAEVTLLNTSDETNVYRLSWAYNRQKEDGSYESLKEPLPGTPDLASMIRFSPRQITIPPQGRQSVRLHLQRPSDLPDGEYRIHLTFQQLPKETPLPRHEGPGITMGMRVAIGVSIPVVVRQGEYDAQAKIVDARFVPPAKEEGINNPALMVKVARTGKHGTYGRLRVFWNNGEKQEEVGLLNNFAVYAENSARSAKVPMNTRSIPSGTLHLIYEGDGPQRGKIFAEQEIKIGK